MLRSVITGTGSYIPPFVQSNQDFTKQLFYSENQQPLNTSPEEVVEKFKQITGIEERRYTTDQLNASDIGSLAAKKAIERFRYMAKQGKRDLTEEDIELTLAELKLPVTPNGKTCRCEWG